jgi:hypothetical protein
MVDEVVAMHDRDAGPRIALWSHTDPVTLLGAEMTAWLGPARTCVRGAGRELFRQRLL